MCAVGCNGQLFRTPFSSTVRIRALLENIFFEAVSLLKLVENAFTE